METQIIKLAVAIIPFITFVALVILSEIRCPKRRMFRRQLLRAEIGTRRALEAAATHRWL